MLDELTVSHNAVPTGSQVWVANVRLEQVKGRPHSDGKHIAVCFDNFRAEVSNWEEVVRTVIEHSTSKQIGLEDGILLLVQQAVNNLRFGWISGGVVVVLKRGDTYDSRVVFHKQWELPESVGRQIQVSFPGSNRNGGSFQIVRMSFKDDALPIKLPETGSGMDPNQSPGEKIVCRKLPNLPKLLSSIYREDVKQALSGRGFPWRNLVSHLAEKGFYLDGYPSDIPYPHDTEGNNGCSTLKAVHKMALWRAVKLRNSDHPSQGLRFRPYLGNTADYVQHGVAVIRSRDADGRPVKWLFTDGRVECRACETLKEEEIDDFNARNENRNSEPAILMRFLRLLGSRNLHRFIPIHDRFWTQESESASESTSESIWDYPRPRALTYPNAEARGAREEDSYVKGKAEKASDSCRQDAATENPQNEDAILASHRL
ncbi:hypothetical protein C8R43DRAFT_944854 [Mycena crocata]|nr:hypothetical protein C8R43DRAFT_944854 [Mycena crocata]